MQVLAYWRSDCIRMVGDKTEGPSLLAPGSITRFHYDSESHEQESGGLAHVGRGRVADVVHGGQRLAHDRLAWALGQNRNVAVYGRRSIGRRRRTADAFNPSGLCSS